MWAHGWPTDFLEIFHRALKQFSWYSIVHMHTKVQINFENVLTRESVNYIASFLHFLSQLYQIPWCKKRRRIIRLKTFVGVSKLWTFFFFWCTLIADRIRSSSPVNSVVYKPIWNFFRSRVNLRIKRFFFSYKRTHGNEMFRKSMFQMTIVVS